MQQQGDARQGEAFSRLLNRHRVARALTQEQLAELAGVSPRGIRALEQGERSRPYRSTVALLADALELSGADRAEFETAARSPTSSREGTEAEIPGQPGLDRDGSGLAGPDLNCPMPDTTCGSGDLHDVEQGDEGGDGYCGEAFHDVLLYLVFTGKPAEHSSQLPISTLCQAELLRQLLNSY